VEPRLYLLAKVVSTVCGLAAVELSQCTLCLLGPGSVIYLVDLICVRNISGHGLEFEINLWIQYVYLINAHRR